jgi:GTP-binding protein YchF
LSLSIGIIGAPNAGKSTLFNALTRAGAPASPYPFCTVDRNVGVVEVPDGRLRRLNDLLRPESCTPATVQFVDIAGLVWGASRGEGLGNRFLAHIREVDAVAHVLRCFDDETVAHVEGTVDPLRDAEVVETELMLADLETCERAVGRLGHLIRSDAKRVAREVVLEHDTLIRVQEGLKAGRPVRSAGLAPEEQEAIRGNHLLTAKPVLYVANVNEADAATDSPRVTALWNRYGPDRVLSVSARIEEEIGQLPPEERKVFLADLGLKETGLGRLATAGFRLLNLITFYTVANQKLRAWQVVKGTKAAEAAGKIHSDMERGFIRAEVVAFEDLVRHRTVAELHHRGMVRTEGREHEVGDGEVIHILFHV